jgi:hypothetical protein
MNSPMAQPHGMIEHAEGILGTSVGEPMSVLADGTRGCVPPKADLGSLTLSILLTINICHCAVTLP